VHNYLERDEHTLKIKTTLCPKLKGINEEKKKIAVLRKLKL